MPWWSGWACARAEDYAGFLRLLFRLSNVRGALVTMPHKVPTVSLLDEAAVAVQVAGSCNAILRRPDGSLYGDLFDGIGFVRAAKRKGFEFARADCLIVRAGGVGSAIAAAIAAEEPGSIALFDIDAPAAERLAGRLRQRFPDLAVGLRSNDPDGTAWWSMRRRSECRSAIRCPSTRCGSKASPLSATWY